MDVVPQALAQRPPGPPVQEAVAAVDWALAAAAAQEVALALEPSATEVQVDSLTMSRHPTTMSPMANLLSRRWRCCCCCCRYCCCRCSERHCCCSHRTASERVVHVVDASEEEVHPVATLMLGPMHAGENYVTSEIRFCEFAILRKYLSGSATEAVFLCVSVPMPLQ